MKQVEQSDLRKHKLYLMYWSTNDLNLKCLYFFKFLKFYPDTPAFSAMVYGKLMASGFERHVTEMYWKMEDILPLTTETGTATFFEISFDEFAQQVVVETI